MTIASTDRLSNQNLITHRLGVKLQPGVSDRIGTPSLKLYPYCFGQILKRILQVKVKEPKLHSLAVQSINAIVAGFLLLACTPFSDSLNGQKNPSAVIRIKPQLEQPTAIAAFNKQLSFQIENLISRVKALKKVPLDQEFLKRLEQVDPRISDQYIWAIHELHRMSQRDSENREILEELAKNQVVVFDALHSCSLSRSGASDHPDWQDIAYSKFWRLPDGEYLIQLVCNVGAYNRSFSLLLASNISGKMQFKPLKLTYFYRDKDGTVQREESDRGGGSICQEAPWKLTGQYFDESTKELCIWSRYIGIGVCGTKGKYILQDDELVLQEFTAQFDCELAKKTRIPYEVIYP